MRGTIRVSLALMICTLVLLVSNQVQAQEARGTIVGRVLDASGGVIPGATVEVTSKSMGTKLSLEEHSGPRPLSTLGYNEKNALSV